MDFEPPRQGGRAGRREGLVQGGDRMRVEIVHYKNHFHRVQILLLQQPSDFPRPVLPRPALLRVGLPPAAQRLGEQEDTGRPVPYVFAVLVLDPAVFRSQASPQAGEKLQGFSSMHTTG